MCDVRIKENPVEQDGARCILEIMDKAERSMKRAGFKEGTIKLYARRWREFGRWVDREFEDGMASVERVVAFMRTKGIRPDVPAHSLRATQKTIRCAMRILTELLLHDACPRPKNAGYTEGLPARWKALLNEYSRYLVTEDGLQAATVQRRQSQLRQFILFLSDRRVWSPRNLTERHIVGFLRSRSHLTTVSLHCYARNVARFVKYLYIKELTGVDLSEAMPKIRRDRNATLPAIWTAEQVERLLAAIDRASPCGKRDYAILLLAARLGMRFGDIKRLQFENVRWEEERIVLNQAKTLEPLVLPLTEEIGSAIIDYLRNGRPVVEHREIFVTQNTPFAPFGAFSNLRDAFQRYCRRAGLQFGPGRRSGLHSLRHTLASRLLSTGTPLQTITDILGHSSIESTKHYIRLDVETLRQAALEIEEEV